MQMTPESLDAIGCPSPTIASSSVSHACSTVRAACTIDSDGRKVLDGSSGLFTTPAGHCRAEIATAVAKQLQTLDFTPSFMRGHPGAFALADGVAALTPKGLDHVFFCNSGSEAVDTAMKIALAYHLARKEGQRTYFVSASAPITA